MDTDSTPPIRNVAMDCATVQTELILHTSTSSNSLQELSHLDKPYTLTRRRRSYSDSRGDKQVRSPSPIHFSPPLSTRSQRAKRWQRQQSPGYLIRADHPLKIAWDVVTVLLSILYIYITHTSIRDRSIRADNNVIAMICDAWFLVDILLNFVTEYKTDQGRILKRGQAVWARYLTTWFVVDALSLVPWESLYVKPIIEAQNRRRFFKKYFFRTKAVIRVTRVLRGRHLRLFGKVARHSKHAGVGANRLLRLLIKYVPKYLLFYRNMKGVLAVRLLRQVHWMRKLGRNFCCKNVKKDDATDSLTMEEFDDYDDYLDDHVMDSNSIVQIQMDDDLDLY
jgi:hypothetical protein